MTTAAPEVPFTLSAPQWAVHTSGARFRVLIAGRRFGKTHLANVELLLHAAQKQRATCWYVAPTYRMAKEIAWRQLKSMVPPELLASKPNETDLTVSLINGSVIALRGADNPDSLRGVGLDLAVLDEFAWIHPSAWSDVLRPALADRGGRALFITSPAGHNWAYDLYMRGKAGEHGWAAWQFTTLDGRRVSPEELEEARATLDPRIFRQEFEASFETLQGRVYSNFDRDLNVDASVVDTGAEILVGQDFNINPMATVIAVRAGDECHVLDAIEIPTSNTEEVAAEIRSRYPHREIYVYPDPSGKARRTSAPVGQTDFTILERHGFHVIAPPSAPLVVDRVNNAQAMLLSADGRRRLKIHPRASALIRALDGLTYKEGTSQPDKSLGLDHVCFAAGTPVLTARGEVPIEQVEPGDLALTRSGYFPVAASAMTHPDAEIWEVEFTDGRRIIATPDHPFWVEGEGFLPLRELTQSAILFAWKRSNLSHSTELPSAVTQNRRARRHGTISCPAEAIVRAELVAFTKKYGRRTTDQFRRGTTSTTEMAIRSTTTSPIWSACPPESTSPTIPNLLSGYKAAELPDTWDPSGTLPPSGMGQMKVGYGTASTQSEHGRPDSQNGSRAPFAVKRPITSSPLVARSSFVPGTARPPNAALQASTTKIVPANGVVNHSGSTDTERPARVHGVAAHISAIRPVGSAPVYNLTVDGPHEYFAGGILVSNCDALGYLLWSEFNVLEPERDFTPQPYTTATRARI